MDVTFDVGAGDDLTALAVWRSGTFYVCTVPEELGAVTDLAVQNGRVVAETESGIQFIVPIWGSK